MGKGRRAGAGGRLGMPRWLGPWLLLLAIASWTGMLRAAPPEVTIATPVGWSTRDVDGRARARVDAWLADRADARAQLVLTPGSGDDFTEVLATIAIDGPLALDADPRGELERATAGMMPFDANATIEARAADGDRPQLVIASWTLDAIAYRVALVPSGSARTLLVLATLDSEAPLYQRTFDAALASLQGAHVSAMVFDRGRWRTIVLAAWILPAALLLALMLWRRPFGASAAWIGRSFALAYVAAALVAGWVVHGRLVEQEDALRRAALSAETITAETVSYGIAVAIVCWLVGAWLSRGEGPIDSAPSSGAFAGRSTSAPIVQIPVVPYDRRRHPDGPSKLDPATAPPGGGLRAIDPGVEPREPD